MRLKLQNEPDNGPLFNFLKHKRIDNQRIDHLPVYTVEGSKKLEHGLKGGATQNFFLLDRKGERHILFCIKQEKQVDLKQISSLLDSSKISFTSPKRLKKHLGILPGSVSLQAMINDPSGTVKVVIDEDLWQEETILYHPLVNTSTLALSRKNLEQFIQKTGHKYHLLQVPLTIRV